MRFDDESPERDFFAAPMWSVPLPLALSRPRPRPALLPWLLTGVGLLMFGALTLSALLGGS